MRPLEPKTLPTRAKSVRVRIVELRTDRATQTRVSIDADTVRQYAKCIGRGDKFPPIKVYRVNGELWVVDGLHRVEAAKQCGFDSIDAEIFDGTAADAFWASVNANQTHGLRRSNKDKRFMTEQAVRRFPDLSARNIADRCGVSHELVAGIMRQLSNPDTRLGRDGKRRRVPRRKPKEASERASQPERHHQAETTAFDEDERLHECAEAYTRTLSECPAERAAKFHQRFVNFVACCMALRAQANDPETLQKMAWAVSSKMKRCAISAQD